MRAGQEFDSKIPVKLTSFFSLCLYLCPTKSSRACGHASEDSFVH